MTGFSPRTAVYFKRSGTFLCLYHTVNQSCQISWTFELHRILSNLNSTEPKYLEVYRTIFSLRALKSAVGKLLESEALDRSNTNMPTVYLNVIGYNFLFKGHLYVFWRALPIVFRRLSSLVDEHSLGSITVSSKLVPDVHKPLSKLCLVLRICFSPLFTSIFLMPKKRALFSLRRSCLFGFYMS